MNIATSFSSYLKAADIGNARPVVVMDFVAIEEVGEEKEKKPVLHFVGKEKCLILNKTNADTIVALTGTAETEQWKGQPIRLWVDPTVRFGGKLTPAIRIMSAAGGPAPTLPVAPPQPPPPVYQAPAEYGIPPQDDDCPF